MAHCLGIVDIHVVGTVDAQGREYIQPFQLCAHRYMMPPPAAETLAARRDWFWMDKNTNAGLANCCAAYPVAFHSYKDPAQLERFYSILGVHSSKAVSFRDLEELHACR